MVKSVIHDVAESEAKGAAPTLLVRRLAEVQGNLTKSESRIAQFLRLNEARLLMETGVSIADKTGVSEITVSRFLRRIGYKGIAALKNDLREAELDDTLSVKGRHLRLKSGALGASLTREAEAVLQLAEQIARPEWAAAIKAIDAADEIDVTGYQTVRGLAEDFSRRLSIVRGAVRFMSAHDGGLAEWIPSQRRPDRKRLLIMIDVAPFAREAEQLAGICQRSGVDLVVVSDELNGWAANCTDHVFHAGSKVGTFLESTGPMATLLNLMTHAVAELDPEKTRARIDAWPGVMRGLGIY